jgi:hypothetical protein
MALQRSLGRLGGRALIYACQCGRRILIGLITNIAGEPSVGTSMRLVSLSLVNAAQHLASGIDTIPKSSGLQALVASGYRFLQLEIHFHENKGDDFLGFFASIGCIRSTSRRRHLHIFYSSVVNSILTGSYLEPICDGHQTRTFLGLRED